MGTVTFRPATRADFPLLGAWLAEPHVARWWNHETEPAALERDFGGSVDGTEPTELLLVLLDGAPVGLLQRYRYDAYPEHIEELGAVLPVPDGAVSIDYLIGDPAAVGRGVGARMIATAAEDVWRSDPGASCIIVPVASANEASWRALLRAGFRLVARGPLAPDNPIDDPMHEVLRLDRPAR